MRMSLLVIFLFIFFLLDGLQSYILFRVVVAKVWDHTLIHTEVLFILHVLGGGVVDLVKERADLEVGVCMVIEVVVCKVQNSQKCLVLFVPKNEKTNFRILFGRKCTKVNIPCLAHIVLCLPKISIYFCKIVYRFFRIFWYFFRIFFIDF